MKIASFRLLCLALAIVLMTSTDAFAFGKRGKGIFGWRGSSSCGSGSAQSAGACGSCPAGSCAQGQCATGCENGQCSPAQAFGQGTVFRQVCEGGKCFLVAESGPSSSLKSSETMTLHKDKDAWKDASGKVWKQK